MKEQSDDTSKYNAKQHYVWRIDLKTKAVQGRQGSQKSQDPQSMEMKYILLHKLFTLCMGVNVDNENVRS